MGSSTAPKPDPEFLALADRAFPTLGDLFDAGEDVESLMAHPGWAHVCRLLDESIATVDSRLDGGLLESRAAYAQAHGRRGALRAAFEAAAAIRYRADEKRAEQRAKHERAAEALEVVA